MFFATTFGCRSCGWPIEVEPDTPEVTCACGAAYHLSWVTMRALGSDEKHQILSRVDPCCRHGLTAPPQS
jgi:hypothetical protein